MNEVAFSFRDYSEYTYFRDGLGRLLNDWFPQDHTLIEIAVNEAINNAIIHGCRSAADPLVEVQIERSENGGIRVRIKDRGTGFDVSSDEIVMPVPGSEPVMKESGRGLWIMKHVFDEIRFNDSGNEITLVKEDPAPGEDNHGG